MAAWVVLVVEATVAGVEVEVSGVVVARVVAEVAVRAEEESAVAEVAVRAEEESAVVAMVGLVEVRATADSSRQREQQHTQCPAIEGFQQ